MLFQAWGVPSLISRAPSETQSSVSFQHRVGIFFQIGCVWLVLGGGGRRQWHGAAGSSTPVPPPFSTSPVLYLGGTENGSSTLIQNSPLSTGASAAKLREQAAFVSGGHTWRETMPAGCRVDGRGAVAPRPHVFTCALFGMMCGAVGAHQSIMIPLLSGSALSSLCQVRLQFASKLTAVPSCS